MATAATGGIYDRVLSVWWGKALLGLLVVGSGMWLFSDFSKLESGETKAMLVNSTTKLLYDLGGKWTVAGLAWVIGAAIFGWGVAQLVRGKE